MIENGIDFGPGTVSGATVATYVKTLSPAMASPPLRPSSKNCWLAEPPIAAGTQLTVNDRERNRLWTRHGERRDCRYVREDVVACDGITAVKTIIKELLASGTTNRRKIRSYDNTGARRICPRCNGHCQCRRCTRQD